MRVSIGGDRLFLFLVKPKNAVLFVCLPLLHLYPYQLFHLCLRRLIKQVDIIAVCFIT